MTVSKPTPTKPHVVVVGAGMIGASIAFHCALRGAQVTIVDGGLPGQGTTRVSFAWLNAYGKTPFHYHDLNRRSMEMWSRFARLVGGGITLTWGGELRWAVTEKGADELVTRSKGLQSWGYPNQILSEIEVNRLEPELNTDGLIVASYSYLDGHVDTGQAVQATLAAAGERGAELCIGSPVTGIDVSNGRTEGVMVGKQLIPADAVVLAGGADMPALAGLAGVVLPLSHSFGATILTTPVEPLFQNIALLHSPRDRTPHVNFRQFADGSVMIQGNGTGDYDDGDRGTSDEEVAQIVADAISILPALKGVQIQQTRRGRRPIPKDGEPIIGFSDEVTNLYLATTHSGITLAPIIGELAAIEIVDRSQVALLEPFRIERFGH